MFYHCAHSLHGEGFVIHHKKCPSGFVFNGLNKKCEANQLKANRNLQAKASFSKKQELTEFFHCSHTGLFPGNKLFVRLIVFFWVISNFS